MYTVCIIGAGQLGSRHLQAIARVALPLTVYVVDIAEQSLKTAKERFEEIEGYQQKAAFYLQTLDDLPVELDLVIIASNSISRRSIIEALLTKCIVKYMILEKFLFPRLSDYDPIEKLLKEKGVKTWVNCARRAFDFYKKVAASIKGEVHFSVIGANWGLGCNSIHFFDLFSGLSRSREPYVINERLDDTLLGSKRQGYVEFTGTLYLGSEKGDTLEVVSYQDGTHPLIIKIATPREEWIINESKREYVYTSDENGWQSVHGSFHIPMQSEVGAIVITDLLEKGSCELTLYEDSQFYHKVLLNVFLKKYNSVTNNKNGDLCPIT